MTELLVSAFLLGLLRRRAGCGVCRVAPPWAARRLRPGPGGAGGLARGRPCVGSPGPAGRGRAVLAAGGANAARAAGGRVPDLAGLAGAAGRDRPRAGLRSRGRTRRTWPRSPVGRGAVAAEPRERHLLGGPGRHGGGAGGRGPELDGFCRAPGRLHGLVGAVVLPLRGLDRPDAGPRRARDVGALHVGSAAGLAYFAWRVASRVVDPRPQSMRKPRAAPRPEPSARDGRIAPTGREGPSGPRPAASRSPPKSAPPRWCRRSAPTPATPWARSR